jgi:hypothetical protein
MTDQNRKTLRSFYCRDYLWETFEQMTHDLGCSMDYLINESMRLYARGRDYAPSEDGPSPPNGGGFGGPPAGGGFGGPPAGGGFGGGGNNPLSGGFGGGAMEHRTFDRIPPVGGGGQQPNQRGGFGGPPSSGSGGPPPPPPRPGGGGGGGFGGPPQQGGGFGGGGGGGFGGPPQQGGGFGGQQRPQQGGGFGGGAAAQGQQPLYLLFNNNRYVVDKEKFVIGRGSQQTDLTIRDGNISRKHCAVLYRNGSYYIKDLDSTNGVEFRGNRIESKKVDEGDVFYLCDYELRFTYRP